MSKRLRVVISDADYRDVARLARKRAVPVAEVVRESLRRTVEEAAERSPEERIASVLRFARRDPKHLAAAYEALEAMVSRIVEVTTHDVDGARTLLVRHPRLSSRYALHAAVMGRLGCRKIWSHDAAFDALPSLLRVH